MGSDSKLRKQKIRSTNKMEHLKGINLHEQDLIAHKNPIGVNRPIP